MHRKSQAAALHPLSTVASDKGVAVPASRCIQRFASCSAGITPRFGIEVFDRLEKEKTIRVKDPTVTTGPQGWTLTEEVRAAEVKRLVT